MYAALLAAAVHCQEVLAVIASEDGGKQEAVFSSALSLFCRLNHSHSPLLHCFLRRDEEIMPFMQRHYAILEILKIYPEKRQGDGNLLLLKSLVKMKTAQKVGKSMVTSKLYVFR